MSRVTSSSTEYTTTGVFTDMDFPRLRDLIGSAVSPLYSFFGEWSYFIVGFVLITGLIPTGLLIINRMYLTFTVHGCTWRFMTVFSSELFHLFYLPARIISALYREFRKGPAEKKNPVNEQQDLVEGGEGRADNDADDHPEHQVQEFRLY